MITGMTPAKVKIAITVRPDLLERVRKAVDSGQAGSVSAYIEHAIAAQLEAEEDWDAMSKEVFAATGGPPTDAERLEARRMLGVPDR